MLLLVLACTFLVPQGHAAPAYVQSTSCGTTGGAVANCLLNGVAAHHTLFDIMWECGPYTPTDTFTLNYTAGGSATNPHQCSLRQRISITNFALTLTHSGSDTLTSQPNGTSIGQIHVFAEYSGLLDNNCSTNLCTSLLDGTPAGASGTAGGSGTISSGTVTTTVANTLIICGGTISSTGGAGTLTSASAGMTTRNSVFIPGDGDGNPTTNYLADILATTPGTYSCDWTLSGSGHWQATATSMLSGSSSGGTGAKRKHPPQIVRWLRATRPGGKWNA